MVISRPSFSPASAFRSSDYAVHVALEVCSVSCDRSYVVLRYSSVFAPRKVSCALLLLLLMGRINLDLL